MIPGNKYFIYKPYTAADGHHSGTKIGIFNKYFTDAGIYMAEFVELKNVPGDTRDSGMGTVSINEYPVHMINVYPIQTDEDTLSNQSVPMDLSGGRTRQSKSRRRKRKQKKTMRRRKKRYSY
jgi:hypothetical protein